MRLHRLDYSCYARFVQATLELAKVPFELVDVRYGDREELAKLTGGYIQVPVLELDDGTAIVDSRRVADRPPNELGDGGWELQREGELLGRRTHLPPRALQDADELLLRVVGVLGGEIGDLVLEEDEARGVLEGLGAGVGLQAGFGNPGGDFLRLGGGHAGLQ